MGRLSYSWQLAMRQHPSAHPPRPILQGGETVGVLTVRIASSSAQLPCQLHRACARGLSILRT